MESRDPEDSGAKLHRDCLVIDICGTTNFALPAPVAADGSGALGRARSGGINAVVLTVSAYDESSGGVVGVAAWSPLNRQAPERLPTIEDYLDHVEYVLSVVGPDAISLGLDLNENSRALPGRSGFAMVYAAMDADVAALPQSVSGLDSLADVPAITAGLLRRRVDPAIVTKLLGANFLRVAEQCWAGW